MIINKVTGNSWQHEVQSRTIGPLGLRHTFTPDTFPVIPGPHAVGYQRFTKDGPDVDVTAFNPSRAGAAGEMISTTEDGNTFLRAVASGKLLRPPQLAEMRKTVPAHRFDAAWPGIGYGLGIMWIPNSCGSSWSHSGDFHGFMTRDGISADGTRSIVVSINTDSPVPKPGIPVPTKNPTIDLIDHALCPKA